MFRLQRAEPRVARLGGKYVPIWQHWFSTHLEVAPAGVALPDGEGEPQHRGHRPHVQGPRAGVDVVDEVQEQQALVVARVDRGADLNGQLDGRGPTHHGDISVFCSEVEEGRTCHHLNGRLFMFSTQWPLKVRYNIA